MVPQRHNEQKDKRRVVLFISLLPIAFVLPVVFAWRPILIQYFLTYTKTVLTEVMYVNERFEENELQLALQEWKLYQMESRFLSVLCQDNAKPRKDVTWLTTVVNRDYAISALVLGHSIQTFSCYQNMIAFISNSVDKNTVQALQKVGWSTRLVEEMDCNWLDEKLGGQGGGFLARPEGPRIRGTHTRFHAWNYTQFTKIIYVDADFMLMSNIDELFDIPDDFAAVPCARPGVLEPCFNAGLLVIRPDTKHYDGIMKLWIKTTQADVCPNDQVLLWHYYADADNWKPLPFSFNIRRVVYRPVRAFHFANTEHSKPWEMACRPSREDAKLFKGPIQHFSDFTLLFWKNLYELLIRHDLENWWQSTRFYKPSQELSSTGRFSDCWLHSKLDI